MWNVMNGKVRRNRGDQTDLGGEVWPGSRARAPSSRTTRAKAWPIPCTAAASPPLVLQQQLHPLHRRRPAHSRSPPPRPWRTTCSLDAAAIGAAARERGRKRRCSLSARSTEGDDDGLGLLIVAAAVSSLAQAR